MGTAPAHISMTMRERLLADPYDRTLGGVNLYSAHQRTVDALIERGLAYEPFVYGPKLRPPWATFALTTEGLEWRNARMGVVDA